MANRIKSIGREMRMSKTPRLIPQDPFKEIRRLYDRFNASITGLDCGVKCALFNPSGRPFCCDICHAVPAVYDEEWDYLKVSTDLWHLWRGDECAESEDSANLQEETPEGMVLLVCKGPASCQRRFRALSCRQFPFFPYVTEDYRFIGLAIEWELEDRCWVVSNLNRVSKSYREGFIDLHDGLFAQRQDIFDNYAYHSERMRSRYAEKLSRIPLLHRNGNDYLISPRSERLARIPSGYYPRFGPYQNENYWDPDYAR